MSSQNTYSYSTVTGYFLQDEIDIVAENFEHISTNFGLINRNYISDKHDDKEDPKTQWQCFEEEVKLLNDEADEDVVYKVLYMGRHGQGAHNVAEKRYGTAEWDRHYASLEGDSLAHWADAHLTDTGIQQALAANTFWKRQIAEAKTPPPERYYVSPLYRCLETCTLTFAALDLPADRPFEPIVKELVREVMGVHTCDRRSSLSFLRSSFPHCVFEPSMTEGDELWEADHRETNEELDARMKRLLDDVFSTDASTSISFTSHSGAIGSLLRVLKHREFRLGTGGVIPVLVRAQRQGT